MKDRGKGVRNRIGAKCFVGGTLVAISTLPHETEIFETLWGNECYVDDLYNAGFSSETASGILAVSAAKTALLIPIEDVQIGSRVSTKNPKPWEYDDSLREPDEESWTRICMTFSLEDGGIVDSELIRPRSWVETLDLQVGSRVVLKLSELQVRGNVEVTAIDPCPPISRGDGSVVTGRFTTRQVNVIARAEILGSNGQVEIIEGTVIHPVWSLDRQDWVPLGELSSGEQLQGTTGPATAIAITISRAAVPVYNIEVHGEHVYEVGKLGLLVHNIYTLNSGETVIGFISRDGKLIGKLEKAKIGHAALADLYPDLVSRLKSGDVVAVTIHKMRDGTIKAFGSGTFPPPGGTLSGYLQMFAERLVQ